MIDGEGVDVAPSEELGATPVATEEVEASVESPEGAEPEGQGSPEQQPSGDNRTLPRDIQRALKALRENPDTSKVAGALNDSFFRNQRLDKEFPAIVDPATGMKVSGIDQAVAMKRTLDLIGGEGGIQKLQSDADAMRLVDEDIERGDPGFIDDIVKEFPDGFKKLVPHVINKLYELDKDAFSRALAPTIGATLRSYGVMDRLTALDSAIGANDVAAAKRIIGELRALPADVDEIIKNSKASQLDPEREKYQKKETELNQREEKMFNEGVGKEVNNYRNSLVSKSLAPLLKKQPLAEGARKRLVSQIYSDLDASFRGNEKYKTNLKGVLRGKDHGKAVSYINSEMDLIVPRIVQSVWKDLYGTVPKPNGNGNGKPAAESGFLPQAPRNEDIDWSRSKVLYLTGRAYLKTGKLVQWKK